MTALAADVTVVGAGLTGIALAYGLARRGARVVLLDARDPLGQLAPSVAPLLAQQAILPGAGTAHLARLAVESWSDFDGELSDIAGCHSQYRRDGGLYLCRDSAALDARAAALQVANRVADRAAIDTEMLGAAALRRLVPQLDSGIAGASYCADDARISPHALRRALGFGLARLGVDYRPHCRVQWVREQGGEWVVMAQDLAVGCGRVALTCGHAGSELAPSGALLPALVVHAGSVVQLQALMPFLPFATAQLNQSGDGSVHLDTRGLGEGEQVDVAGIQARATAFCRGLDGLRVVKTWHADTLGFRDGSPCYQPLDGKRSCWLLAAPDSLFFVPVHAGIVADAVMGRIDDNALCAFQSGQPVPTLDTPTKRPAVGGRDTGSRN